jgi:hypothetical protein
MTHSSENPVEVHQANPMELAMLAALIDPEGCKKPDAREPLFRAMALFQQSHLLCQVMASKGAGKVDWLYEQVDGPFDDHSAACQLISALSVLPKWAPVTWQEKEHAGRVLTFSSQRNDPGTLQEYLEQHCQLEGTGNAARKSWATFRKTKENLATWVVFLTNKRNRELRDGTLEASEVQKRWATPEEEVRKFFQQWRVEGEEGGRGANAERWAFPVKLVDKFIEWRKWIRTNGGMKSVLPARYPAEGSPAGAMDPGKRRKKQRQAASAA